YSRPPVPRWRFISPSSAAVWFRDKPRFAPALLRKAVEELDLTQTPPPAPGPFPSPTTTNDSQSLPSPKEVPPQSPPPKFPSEQAIQCFQIRTLRGDSLTQAAIGKMVYGRPDRQYQVARDLARVKAFLAGGGILPELEMGRPRVISIDPSKIDRGARE